LTSGEFTLSFSINDVNRLFFNLGDTMFLRFTAALFIRNRTQYKEHSIPLPLRTITAPKEYFLGLKIAMTR